MKLAWHFNKVNPRFKNREATQGEFFTNDTELRGFIREAIQNSLDAKRPRVKQPVRVRIFISGEKAALPADKAERYFSGGWDHFHADGCGLREAPGADEACRFIAYEDTGTTGLTGDVGQYHEIPGVRNPFYYFFRAEGQSNKTDGGRGRWGLGKFVFPRSSRIRSFFGVTVRHDDKKRVLVGQSILRSHHVGEKSFTPDGWFGKKPDRNEASLPVTDQRFINKFAADFRLKLAYDPGLSLVVPYCDERWTASAVMEAIVQDYFYPILHNDLIVSITDSPLTAFLGDAENPAHTEWSEESSHFKGKYQNGAATLRQIRNAVADLCQTLTESADDQDPVLLLDVFSTRTTNGKAGVPVNFPAMSSRSTDSNLLRLKGLSSRPTTTRLFGVTSRKGGFRVASRPNGRMVCAPLDVFVAYDRRGGSPLRKYVATDFQLNQDPIVIKSHNAIVQVLEPNHLVIYPQRNDFDVVVTGFDVNRDLFLKAHPMAAIDGIVRRAG